MPTTLSDVLAIPHQDVTIAVESLYQAPAEALEGVPVYLFKGSGSYLGKYERTDTAGVAEFLLPDQQYKFRVDYEGTQYWSDVVTIIPHEENNVELNLDLLALDLTNDPNPVRSDGVPPKRKIVVASLGSLAGLLVRSVVAQTPAEHIYYCINDHLGTPLRLIDDSGAVVWAADYKPFGKADLKVSTAENDFRFPDQYQDSETGLHYNWHRYYDSGIGRYLRADPLDLSSIQMIRQSSASRILSSVHEPYTSNLDQIQRLLLGSLLYQYSLLNSQRLNVYLYVQNNPVIYTDRFGLFSFPPYPPGQHRERDEAGFFNCMTQTNVLAVCAVCAASAITGYGIYLGLPACLACLQF
ncbi:RHS domain-containing protein, partial [bacterium]|nr:RHS domain-containing protein [bacterium]